MADSANLDAGKYRLVLKVNPRKAKGFFGGAMVASPLAHYYHLKKHGKVIWSGHVRGMAGYPKTGKSLNVRVLRDIAAENKELSVDDVNKRLNKNERISRYGYIYQPYDPAMDSVRGIAWEFEIDKFIFVSLKDLLDNEEYKEYILPAKIIGHKECEKCFFHKRKRLNLEKKWHEKRLYILIKNMKMLAEPITPKNQKNFGFRYKQSSIYKNSKNDKKWNLALPPGSEAWVHLSGGKNWPTDYRDENEFSPPNLVTKEILNNHIKESLVHEILTILFAKEGWHFNNEVQVTYRKERGRVDFVMKRETNAPWQIIEVKLADNPDAVGQLNKYISGIKSEVRRKKCDAHFCLIQSLKEMEGIIICPENEKDETVKCSRKRFKVWTYSLGIPGQNRLSFTLKDENGLKIVSTEND